MYDDTYLNKSRCIIAQGMFTLREINQMEREICNYLDGDEVFVSQLPRHSCVEAILSSFIFEFDITHIVWFSSHPIRWPGVECEDSVGGPFPVIWCYWDLACSASTQNKNVSYRLVTLFTLIFVPLPSLLNCNLSPIVHPHLFPFLCSLHFALFAYWLSFCIAFLISYYYSCIC